MGYVMSPHFDLKGTNIERMKNTDQKKLKDSFTIALILFLAGRGL